jgi:hypothetical protein
MSTTARRAIAATGLFALGANACAVDLLPRAGLQVASYLNEAPAGDTDTVAGGLTLGLTVAGDRLFADFNFEALPVDLPGRNGVFVSGWRSEAAATLGIRVHEGVLLIAGYRISLYGERFGKGTLADNSGPFVGVHFPELRLGSSNRDVLSLSIAIQRTTLTDKVSRIEEHADTGVNIRLGYRRAGSPHSFGVRYQSFGSPTYQEYLTTLQYSYVFGSF